MDIKEYFRQRLDEAIRADKTSRQKQSRIRKVRGVDRKRENRVTPYDHPVLDIADPRNRAMLRAGFSDAAAKAHGRAMDSALKAEFGGTDPVYEAVKKLIKKKKATSGDTDASY